MRPNTTLASVTVGSTPPVPYAAGPGVGAGASWPDAERATRVAVGDRPAAGPDRVDVDHRHEQRVPRDRGVPRLRLDHPAFGDDADVGRGPAHVEGDQARARPSICAAHSPPNTPAAGPDSINVTGRRAA